jgi:hypothetical protein
MHKADISRTVAEKILTDANFVLGKAVKIAKE